MSAFDQMASITASTKRNPSVDEDGLRGAATTNVASLACFPLDPLSSELRERYALDSPYTSFQTMTRETDITRGDIFVVSNVEYQVRGVEAWRWRGSEVYTLVVLEKSAK